MPGIINNFPIWFMRIKIDIHPKEWVVMAIFILMIFLTFSGKTQDAIRVVKYWLHR